MTHQHPQHTNHPGPPAPLTTTQDSAQWSVSETLSGRRLLVTGTTGFLGKVYLSMLLRFHPDIDQIFLLIRPRPNQSAQARFFDTIATSAALDPVREIYEDGFVDFLKEKITPLAGDVTLPNLGLDESEARALSSQLDAIVNSAGLTNFNPNLESALKINTLSQKIFLDFIALGDNHASYMHVSTCFVAGNVDGDVPETLPNPTIYPKYAEIGTPYDAEREIADCLALIEHAQALADDQERQTQFARRARQTMRERNLDPNDSAAFDHEVDQARWRWLRDHLSQQGRQRAAFWGWPNIYTYTKSLGERLLAQARDQVNLCVYRPAVVESAVSFPSPGWNEGINTSAPLIYLMSKGHRQIPTQDDFRFDAIPVDYVAGGMIAVTAALIRSEQHDAYHSGSSHRNPVSMHRLIELSTLANRRARSRDPRTPTWRRILLNSMDGVPVDESTFHSRSAPGFKRAARGLKGWLDKVPAQHLGGLGKAVNALRRGVAQAEKLALTTEKIFELFLPFIARNNYRFRADNLAELSQRLPQPERQRYGSLIDDLCWRRYWMDIHVPGLHANVFPALDDKFASRASNTYTYDSLIELFEASTLNFGQRIALQHHDGAITERYTYADLKEYADRAVHVLRSHGVSNSAAALIASENRPQWGMAYFGILKAGGVAVPVDPDSSADELANLIASSKARALIISDRVHERIGADLEAAISRDQLPVQLLRFNQLFALSLPPATDAAPATASALSAPPLDLLKAAEEGEPIASLIFTSGTTGKPKGVMLTHGNFTSLLTSLQETFDVDQKDSFLSVLPLHHTFEFACGFLMPLSKGSTITYLEDLTGEELSSAMNTADVSAVIGVPALWQLLSRRIRSRLDSTPAPISWTLNQLIELNTSLRDRLGLNLGETVFRSVHLAFGGNLRYLISGGAALPSDVLKTFYGLGFNLYEGYGLTEAAPVLTVNRPEKGFFPGKVGEPLPGVEIDILDPNEDGIGEVVARGKNVMRGYLDLDDQTQRTLRDGWLHTGDLGRIDDGGRLALVGREKEVIVTSGGKNVYPDELEDIYGACPDVRELSVVGLPDRADGERVACLIRPELADDASDENRALIESSIREWVRVEGARIATHKRIRVLRFCYQDLPRTATRKIKRRDVIELLERLHHDKPLDDAHDTAEESRWGWLYAQIAELADVDIRDIHPSTHFVDDLGFDSLMVVELGSALAQADHAITTPQLADIFTVGELQALLKRDASPGSLAVSESRPPQNQVDSLAINPSFAQLGRKALGAGQMKAYDALFDVEVYGRAHIPWHNPNVIVAANHTSHLDMGLVKYALGDFGRDIRALAAADYFFGNPLYKTYFQNFTNLIPVERSGTMEQALSGAVDALHRGENILLFPEGTRSTSGKLKEFKRGIGYLAATERVDILPLYLDGTYRALPKGQSLPNPAARALKVRIGPPISVRDLVQAHQHLPDAQLYQRIADETRQAIVTLRDAGRISAGSQEPVDYIFNTLRASFDAANVDQPLSFYVSLGAERSHKWTIDVAPQSCQIAPGKPDGQADCVIKTSPALFDRIVHHHYTPTMDEFMTGDIKTNSPQLLMQFQRIFQL